MHRVCAAAVDIAGMLGLLHQQFVSRLLELSGAKSAARGKGTMGIRCFCIANQTLLSLISVCGVCLFSLSSQ